MAPKVRRVGIHEAKTHLSRLLREVERGGEVIVERGGHPVARIVRAGDIHDPARSYGMFAGQFVIASDFDGDQDQLADDFGIP
jgi:prevent-host-death family protein